MQEKRLGVWEGKKVSNMIIIGLSQSFPISWVGLLVVHAKFWLRLDRDQGSPRK